MVNINAYINSGILEQHCLDVFDDERSLEIATLSQQYPEIANELNTIQDTLEMLALRAAVTPAPRMKNSIFAALGFADEEHIDLNNLPPTSKYSDYNAWLKAVEHLLPAQPFDDFFAYPLKHDERIAQTLVVTKMNVPDEIHDEIGESFFILEGQCACTVGDEVFTLNAGDHLDIPLHTNHDIKILSPYVIAILQHQFSLT